MAIHSIFPSFANDERGWNATLLGGEHVVPFRRTIRISRQRIDIGKFAICLRICWRIRRRVLGLIRIGTNWGFQEFLNCFNLLIANTDYLNSLVEEAFLEGCEMGIDWIQGPHQVAQNSTT